MSTRDYPSLYTHYIKLGVLNDILDAYKEALLLLSAQTRAESKFFLARDFAIRSDIRPSLYGSLTESYSFTKLSILLHRKTGLRKRISIIIKPLYKFKTDY